jgi:hypothetical protein
MKRHCDGQDQNLIMYVDPETGERDGDVTEHPRVAKNIVPIQKPCDCGRVFDDVYRSTVYPHGLI